VLETLLNGETIKIWGIWEFETKEKLERNGTNPKNFKKMIIKGGIKPYMKFGKRFKKAFKDKEMS
jgi:nucleoid DNA-binding protein